MANGYPQVSVFDETTARLRRYEYVEHELLFRKKSSIPITPKRLGAARARMRFVSSMRRVDAMTVLRCIPRSILTRCFQTVLGRMFGAQAIRYAVENARHGPKQGRAGLEKEKMTRARK